MPQIPLFYEFIFYNKKEKKRLDSFWPKKKLNIVGHNQKRSASISSLVVAAIGLWHSNCEMLYGEQPLLHILFLLRCNNWCPANVTFPSVLGICLLILCSVQFLCVTFLGLSSMKWNITRQETTIWYNIHHHYCMKAKSFQRMSVSSFGLIVCPIFTWIGIGYGWFGCEFENQDLSILYLSLCPCDVPFLLCFFCSSW